jgi:hypothetical protein
LDTSNHLIVPLISTTAVASSGSASDGISKSPDPFGPTLSEAISPRAAIAKRLFWGA